MAQSKTQPVAKTAPVAKTEPAKASPPETIDVYVIIDNVHTSIGKKLKDDSITLPVLEAEFLIERKQVAKYGQ